MSLLTILLLVFSIVASSPAVRGTHVTLPLAKRINASGGAIKLVESDRARAAAIKNRSATPQSGQLARRSGSTGVTNSGAAYIASVGVGDPPTTYQLIVDTGSSITWIGADTTYTPTSTSVNTHEPMHVEYGSGNFFGTEWLDTLNLGSGLTISKQSIGVARNVSGISGIDGILGIGPEILTRGTLTDKNHTEIPTVTQNLHSQGIISEEVVSIFFAPTTIDDGQNGELTFGGVDTSKYTGTLTYIPLTTTSPAQYYWGINQSITYDGTTILSETAGILDTGTTLILIASDAYLAYLSATKASYDSVVGLLTFTTEDYAALKSLNFNIGGAAYELTPNGQIWPRSLNTYIGGSSRAIYGIIGNIGAPSGKGLDFVNGMSFLERFYSVFDTPNSRVGLATTSYTYAATN